MYNLSNCRNGLHFCAVALCAQMAITSTHAAPHNLQFQVDNPFSAPEAVDSRFGAAIGSDGKLFYVGAPDYDPTEFLVNAGTIATYPATTNTLLKQYPDRGPYVAGSHSGTAIAANKKFLVFGRPEFTTDIEPPPGAVTLRGLGKLTYPDNDLEGTESEGGYGSSVALFKNVAVVGAPGVQSNRGGAGIVQIASGSLGSFDLDSTPFQPGDRAGTAVGISKNYVAVGCPGRTVGGHANAGAVEVFNAKTFEHVATLENPNPEEGDLFGQALVVGGKLVAIGAPFADRTNGPHKHLDSGLVYQYKGGTTFTLAREIKPRNNSPGGHFGSSMAILGGLMLVGAPDDSEDANGDGTAYLIGFKKGNTIRQVSSPNPVDGGRFGEGLAIMKKGRFVVGAPGEKNSLGEVVGRSYVFKK